ncbi:hypothetical protein MS3_00010499 [Schistosoma haematobium]|uniref:Reverse transcriptase domain-containing protein n=1 Tax=Schistosoma haematobium TaxID=6185 RepID=A0A922LSP1_SCHHA|nr:hypothetical protein MS3_00010499 [Schistosoma haematobium]KAH9592572.1 hypothetical protein MS3_00010499 [Schistosoma haematobium]
MEQIDRTLRGTLAKTIHIEPTRQMAIKKTNTEARKKILEDKQETLGRVLCSLALKHHTTNGLRENRLYIAQTAALWIIVEKSIECNSSPYIIFIYYEKAFDSVDRRTLRNLLRHNEVNGVHCKVVHGGHLTDALQVKTTGVAVVSTFILKYTMKSTNPNTLDVETLEERGSDTGVKALVAKPRTAFLQLKSIYNSKQLPTSQSNKLCEESIMEFQKYSTMNSDNIEKKQLNLRLRRGHTTLLSLMGSELSDLSKSDKSETAEDSYNDFTTISLPYDQANESTNALINEYIPDVLPLTTANLSKYIVKQEIVYWNHVLSQQISMELMNKLNDDKNVSILLYGAETSTTTTTIMKKQNVNQSSQT